jgi:branched-chain amino acid transport system ATP-binding protein
MPDLLNVERLTAGYGEAIVLTDVSFKMAKGEALALLGRNGMGKTTLVNSVIGVTRRISGSISLDGHDITGCARTSAHRRVLAGCRRNVIFFAH